MKIIKVLMTVICLLITAQIYSQHVISSTGAMLKNQSGSISFTLGESFIGFHKQDFASFSEGFQQPGGSNVGINDPAVSQLFVKIFPNPAKDKLFLVSNDYEGSIHVKINNTYGATVLEKSFIGSLDISLSYFYGGFYVLYLNSNNNLRSITKLLVIK